MRCIVIKPIVYIMCIYCPGVVCSSLATGFLLRLGKQFAYCEVWILVIIIYKLKGYSVCWNILDSSESIGTHRILWGEEFSAMQKAGVLIKERTTIRSANISEEQWWMEGLVKQIIWFKNYIPSKNRFHVMDF